MPRQCPPKIRKLLHKFIVRGQFFLEIRIGVHVDDHRQSLIQNHLHRRIQISQVIRRNLVRLLASEHRLRIHAQPYVVKPHSLDQGDVLRGIPRFKMFFRVSLLVIHLREPFAQIDPVPAKVD